MSSLLSVGIILHANSLGVVVEAVIRIVDLGFILHNPNIKFFLMKTLRTDNSRRWLEITKINIHRQTGESQQVRGGDL